MASKVNKGANGSRDVKHVSNTNIETEVRVPPEYPTAQHHLSSDGAGLSGDNHNLTSLSWHNRQFCMEQVPPLEGKSHSATWEIIHTILESEDSLRVHNSQTRVCPFPQQDTSSPQPHTPFILRSAFILLFPPCLGLSNSFISQTMPHAPIHLILLGLINEMKNAG